MAKKKASKAERTVTITFETVEDREELERLARLEGMAPSTFAREMLEKAIRGDLVSNSLIHIEQRIDVLERYVRCGPWMVLKALELRANNEPVRETNEWISDKMPPAG